MTPEKMAFRLQKLHVPNIFGANEIVVRTKQKRIIFTFRGSAKSKRETIRNFNHELDAYLQYAVGYKDVEITSEFKILHGIGHTFAAPNASLTDVLDSLSNMASTMLDGNPEVSFTLDFN